MQNRARAPPLASTGILGFILFARGKAFAKEFPNCFLMKANLKIPNLVSNGLS